MINQFKVLGLASLSILVLTAGWGQVHAATSSTLDILPDDAVRAPATVDVGTVKPIARQSPGRGNNPPPSGNPLWSVPLSVLTATQERPIFSASRRPPPSAVVARSVEPVVVPIPKAAEPERPSLALIGAVVGDSDAIAVFIDRTNQRIVRLRAGETHAGWMLSSVLRREVTLKKDDVIEVLALQRLEGSTGSPGTLPVLPQPVFPPMPAAADTDGSYAPFVPRHTPKNGESDGL